MSKNPKNTVAFQGIAGAHSDMACKMVYPYMDTLACPSFEKLFDAVENGEADIGLVPIENSHAGRVAEIHNLLPNTNLCIIGEYFHNVSHHLLAPKGAKLADIKTIYSHPQALMQCSKNIRELAVEQVAFSDTAAAAKAVSDWKDKSKAALASDLAGELYGLDNIKENMQNSNDNRTLFVSIAKEPIDLNPADDKNILTSMIFVTRNISAGLYKALGGFATNNVNLLKLESYISDYKLGTAQFFITFEGHPEQRNVGIALEELGFFTKKVHLLGIYQADNKRYKKI